MKAFPEPHVIAFRLWILLVSARLILNYNCYERGYSGFETSRWQVCEYMAGSNSFHCHITKKGYRIHFSFNSNTLKFTYLLQCVVYGFQYIGSISILLDFDLITTRQRTTIRLAQAL